jgi:hypothetical protein
MVEEWEKLVSIGFLSMISGITIQIVAVILQTHPSIDVSWSLFSVIFMYPAGISMIAGYAKMSGTSTHQLGLFLIIIGTVSLILEIAYQQILLTFFMPRIIIYSLLIINTISVILAGLSPFMSKSRMKNENMITSPPLM